jgi:hypothetical protein
MVFTQQGNPTALNGFRDILIEDVYFHHNKRNNLSVIHGSGMVIRDSWFNQASGTDPQNGIDFEPNTVGSQLDDILVENCYFYGNDDSAIGIALWFTDGSLGVPLDITINNSHIKDNNRDPLSEPGAIKLQSSDNADGTVYSDPIGGLITFNNTFINGDREEFLWTRLHTSDYLVNFTNLVATDVSSSGNFPIAFWQGRDASSVDYNTGNINFGNALIVHSQSRSLFDVDVTTRMLALENITGSLTVVNPTLSGLFTFDSAYNTANNINVTISQTHHTTLPLQTISLSSSQTNLVESTGQAAVVTVTRTTLDNSFPLGFEYSVTEIGANAEMGVDYSRLNLGGVIPSGANSITFQVKPIENGEENGNRTLSISLVPLTEYTVAGSPLELILSDVPFATPTKSSLFGW